MKERLKKEGIETVTNGHGLKRKATDGKMRMTDVADTEQLLRLIQSIPSLKAEPFKQWLAKTGYERMKEIADPEQSLYGLVKTVRNLVVVKSDCPSTIFLCEIIRWGFSKEYTCQENKSQRRNKFKVEVFFSF